MRPRPPLKTPSQDLFRSRLDAILDDRHELVRLGKLIDWDRFDAAFGQLYVDKRGRPGLPTRLMAGLHLLQHAKGLSDDAVCAAWLENPYYQHFCGEVFFEHQLPLDRSSMSRWRARLGKDKLELLLAETLAAAQRANAVDSAKFERVTIDSTAQTKAIAHPTDSGLLLRAVEWLNRFARVNGLVLRQSFSRLAVRARREVSRLIHGKGHKQALREIRRMRTYVGRLLRDIARKIAGHADLEQAFAPVAEPIARLLAQKTGDRNKIYALHAPEVEYIAKGKARTAMSSASRPPLPSSMHAPRAASSSSAPRPVRAFPMTDTRSKARSPRSSASPGSRSSAPTSTRATAVTAYRSPRSISPGPAAWRHPPSSANCADVAQSNRSSVT